jgi:hypothetical protein
MELAEMVLVCERELVTPPAGVADLVDAARLRLLDEGWIWCFT